MKLLSILILALVLTVSANPVLARAGKVNCAINILYYGVPNSNYVAHYRTCGLDLWGRQINEGPHMGVGNRPNVPHIGTCYGIVAIVPECA